MPESTQRLNLLFSATLSHRVNELAYEHMNNPEIVIVETNKLTVDRVKEQVFYPANEEKIPLLLGLLKSMEAERALVFINTKHVAETVLGWLRGNNFRAGVLSGDVPQNKRERLLQRFKDGEVDILVATDVAARGLHIPMVSHVFNYDLPQDAEDYVHRVGRTARAGASGDAVSFACERYAFSLGDIEDFIGHQIPVNKISAELLYANIQPPIIERFGGAKQRGRSQSREPRGGRQRPSTKPSGRRAERQPPDSKSPQIVHPLVTGARKGADTKTNEPIDIRTARNQKSSFNKVNTPIMVDRKPEVPVVG